MLRKFPHSIVYIYSVCLKGVWDLPQEWEVDLNFPYYLCLQLCKVTVPEALVCCSASGEGAR